jgi:transketolase
MQESQFEEKSDFVKFLSDKALWVRRETLKLHKLSPGTRLASSLSPVEIFVALYYGEILKFNPASPDWQQRDRLIISKGHGSISLYPILADLGFFDKNELDKISQEGSFLGDIPDTRIPGFETINGALGHGLGVACGIAIALKDKEVGNVSVNINEIFFKSQPSYIKTTAGLASLLNYINQPVVNQIKNNPNPNSNSKVFVLLGDGELFEGSVWEAIMFAGHHNLNNLILIIDNNRTAMLDRTKNIIDLEPLEEKLNIFKWKAARVDGHNIEAVYEILKNFKEDEDERPQVLIADTIKGKGVPQLENDSLCHIKSLSEKDINNVIQKLKVSTTF